MHSRDEDSAKKLMFLVAVCETGPIAMIEMDFDHPKNIRKDKKKGKGLTTALLLHYIRELKKKALKKLGPGPLRIWCDCAPSHVGAVDAMKEVFDEVVLQAGRSPDTNSLDAAIFVFMSRYQQDVCRGYSFDEIR